MRNQGEKPFIAIACGGTGGHLFPGIALAEELLIKKCAVGLIVSGKEIDQQIAKSVYGAEVMTISAKAITGQGSLSSLTAFFRSVKECKAYFSEKKPAAVVGMGGFTSAPAIMAGNRSGAQTFLHEANAIPGRANRWLAHLADEAFVYFHQASSSLNMPRVHAIGMPVRNQFNPVPAEGCRMAMGLDPKKPVLLVMGGSQGASGINDLVVKTLPLLIQKFPDLQFIHLTGQADSGKVHAAYAEKGARFVVKVFFTEMEMALGAATIAITRAGASSLAEFAAMQIPLICIPYPHAADNHQYYNALAFQEAGAALILEQHGATPDQMFNLVSSLLTNETEMEKMRAALQRFHCPDAAMQMSEIILQRLGLAPSKKVEPLAVDSELNLGRLHQSLIC